LSFSFGVYDTKPIEDNSFSSPVWMDIIRAAIISSKQLRQIFILVLLEFFNRIRKIRFVQ